MKTVEQALYTYADALANYEGTKKYAGGAVLHFAPMEGTNLFVATFTAYDENGKKSERALPFNKYIKIVNEIEDVLQFYKRNTGFLGRLVGWNPTHLVREFLFEKKVHRMFMIHEDDVIPFIKEYTDKSRVKKRVKMGAEVLIVVG